jgi:hypothetical protein
MHKRAKESGAQGRKRRKQEEYDVAQSSALMTNYFFKKAPDNEQGLLRGEDETLSTINADSEGTNGSESVDEQGQLRDQEDTAPYVIGTRRLVV